MRATFDNCTTAHLLWTRTRDARSGRSTRRAPQNSTCHAKSLIAKLTDRFIVNHKGFPETIIQSFFDIEHHNDVSLLLVVSTLCPLDLEGHPIHSPIPVIRSRSGIASSTLNDDVLKRIPAVLLSVAPTVLRTNHDAAKVIAKRILPQVAATVLLTGVPGSIFRSTGVASGTVSS